MADRLAVRDAYRAQQWEMVVQECAASGLSNREVLSASGNSGEKLLLLEVQTVPTDR